MISPVDATNNQVLVAPLADGAAAFGPAEVASAPGAYLADPSAGFDFKTNQLVVAWRVPQVGIVIATRPTPESLQGGSDPSTFFLALAPGFNRRGV